MFCHPCKLNLVEEKSEKDAGLAQQNGFGPAFYAEGLVEEAW
jgi:hypothetical protein